MALPEVNGIRQQARQDHPRFLEPRWGSVWSSRGHLGDKCLMKPSQVAWCRNRETDAGAGHGHPVTRCCRRERIESHNCPAEQGYVIGGAQAVQSVMRLQSRSMRHSPSGSVKACRDIFWDNAALVERPKNVEAGRLPAFACGGDVLAVHVHPCLMKLSVGTPRRNAPKDPRVGGNNARGSGKAPGAWKKSGRR